MDLNIILEMAWYGLTIVDAHMLKLNSSLETIPAFAWHKNRKSYG